MRFKLYRLTIKIQTKEHYIKCIDPKKGKFESSLLHLPSENFLLEKECIDEHTIHIKDYSYPKTFIFFGTKIPLPTEDNFKDLRLLMPFLGLQAPPDSVFYFIYSFSSWDLFATASFDDMVLKGSLPNLYKNIDIPHYNTLELTASQRGEIITLSKVIYTDLTLPEGKWYPDTDWSDFVVKEIKVEKLKATHDVTYSILKFSPIKTDKHYMVSELKFNYTFNDFTIFDRFSFDNTFYIPCKPYWWYMPPPPNGLYPLFRTVSFPGAGNAYLITYFYHNTPYIGSAKDLPYDFREYIPTIQSKQVYGVELIQSLLNCNSLHIPLIVSPSNSDKSKVYFYGKEIKQFSNVFGSFDFISEKGRISIFEVVPVLEAPSCALPPFIKGKDKTYYDSFFYVNL
jgi:hypothetical protein